MNNLPFGVLIGNITSDPALRYTPGQHAVVTFGIAVNTRKKDGNNWVDGPTKFYDVVVWRELAENVVESMPQGHSSGLRRRVRPALLGGRRRYEALEDRVRRPGSEPLTPLGDG
jgi:hypothetical protein